MRQDGAHAVKRNNKEEEAAETGFIQAKGIRGEAPGWQVEARKRKMRRTRAEIGHWIYD